MNTAHRRRLLIFGTVYFLAYLVAAIVLYKERIFLDGAYYFFHVVQFESFHVEHQRFILIPSQLLAWIGVNLHLPLQMVLLLNSVNPVIYLFALFFICVYWLRDEAAGWALLLLSVCGVYFLYFCPMYEVWYGAALLIFFASLLHKEFYRTPLQLAVLALTSITLLFSYPLMLVGLIFFSLYHFADIKKYPFRVIGVFGVVIITWLIWKTVFISEYENGKISYPFSRMGLTLEENLGSPVNFSALVKFLFTVYAESMIMMIGVLLLLFLKGNYLKGMLVLLFVGGYVLLINVTQNYPWSHTNYYERIYLLLIPLCMLPFLREVYFFSKQKIFFELVFVGIILFRGTQIIQHSKVYSERIKKLNEFIQPAQLQAGSKFFVNGEQYPDNPALNEWSFPMEALIFSSLKNANHTVTVSLKSDLDDQEIIPLLNENTFHLRLNEVRDDEWLNQKYFKLKDGNYEELKVE